VVNIVGYALQFGVSTLLLTVGSWAGDSDGTGATVAAIVIGAATGIATVMTLIASMAFMSAVQALIYLDLRVRREGLDLWMRPVLRPGVNP
jgi:prepilin signal peptidase PulO-like enzyme (type II secretory pathway)